jgi:hypothetical protein
VRHRPHRVDVALAHQAPAYLDEEYPIAIDITNKDDRPLEVVVDVLLQPTEIDHAGKCAAWHLWCEIFIDNFGGQLIALYLGMSDQRDWCEGCHSA